MKMSSERGTEETAARHSESGRSRRIQCERGNKQKQKTEIYKSAEKNADREKKEGKLQGVEREQTVSPLGRANTAEEK